MMYPHKSRIQRVLVVLSLLGLGLWLSTPFATTVEAGFESCQGDPIIKLSDGSLLQVVTKIGLRAADVDAVHYAIHAPQGTALRQVIYVGGPLAAKEHVGFYADQPANVYRIDTRVETRVAGAPVRVTASLLSADDQLRVSAVGDTNQPISLTLQTH